MAGKACKDIWLVSGARTPFGAFGGSLKGFSATDLAVTSSKAALERARIPMAEYDHVVFGNVLQTSADALYLARHVGLKAGLDQQVPAVTVNRLCGSGFEAIAQSANLIELGTARAVLTGGTENMSQAPYVVREGRWGARMGTVNFEDSLTAGLKDSYVNLEMALTAENLAVKYGITRSDVDSYAMGTQQRAKAALDKGYFKAEITPVTWEDKKHGQVSFDKDEHARPETTMESLAKLKPVFKKDGVVTAGNASGIVDGAVALTVASSETVKRSGVKALGRLVGWGVAGCDPKIMGIGPVPAAHEVFRATGLKLSDMDLVEINEAFAAQYLAVEKELGLNREITNVNGGAIAIGHPLGASGARLTLHALYELERRKKRYALVGACIGGGQGMCLIVERAT